MSETLIKVEGVSKKFCRSLKKSLWYGMQDLGREITGHHHTGDGELRPEEFWAVKNVSFELKRGECLGLIGRNGAGKTTLLKILNGLIKPDSGRIEMRGRVGALIALGAGFNPILTGRENIYVNGSILGLSKNEIKSKLDEIIEFSEIGEYIDTPVQNYSSGMQVRLGFSIASTIEPDVLILDEVLAVGDTNFRAKAYKRMGQILKNSAVIFVTHDMTQVHRICDKISAMKIGEITNFNNVNDGVNYYNLLNTSKNLESIQNNCKSINNVIASFALSENKKNSVLEITFYCIEMVEPGYIILNISNSSGVLIGEYRSSIENKVWKTGLNKINIKIGDLSMYTSGVYTMDVAIYKKNRKEILIHLMKVCQIFLTGGYPTSAPTQISALIS